MPPARPSAAATSLVPMCTRPPHRQRFSRSCRGSGSPKENAAFPGRERPGRRGKGGKENWVNTVVRREEELQLGSGVNADGATGHATQSKQNKLGEGGAGTGRRGRTRQPGLGSSLGSCCHERRLQAAKNPVASGWALRPGGQLSPSIRPPQARASRVGPLSCPAHLQGLSGG